MQRITSVNHPHFAAIWDLLQASFHPTERRDFYSLQCVLKDERMALLVYEEGQQVLALAVLWTFEKFDFLEYLAVDATQRAKGYGTLVMKELLAITKRPFLLEVQPPTDLLNQKRIYFYQRLGFVLNPYHYFQPPYHKMGEAIPLQIMSSPNYLNIDNFKQFTQLMKEEVYEKWYE
ncbi:MAG: GNAT family N-acetyltransferase [Siphonobacter sp.]